MAITAQTIITQAWIDLGVGSPGDTMPTNESANGLVKLNMMLDNWSAARDLVYEILDQTFALTAVQTNAIGPTATAPFNVARPTKIENAQILITVGGQVLSHDLDIIGQAEWQSIDDKGATGTLAKKLYFDPQVPNAYINLWPIPLCASTTQLDIGTWTSVAQFAALNTSATLPPAYLRLINLGLQLELIPTYARLVNQAIAQLRQAQFTEALGAVRALNQAVQMIPLAPTQAPAVAVR